LRRGAERVTVSVHYRNTECTSSTGYKVVLDTSNRYNNRYNESVFRQDDEQRSGFGEDVFVLFVLFFFSPSVSSPRAS